MIAVPRVWTLGDSLTYGVSWPSVTPGGWRGMIAAALPVELPVTWVGSSAENPPPGRLYDRHDGHPGWRLDELASLPVADADVVVLQGGTNDLIQRHAPGRSFDGSYDEFDDSQRAAFAADLVGRLQSLCRRVSGRSALVLWTIPPMGLGGPRYGSPTLPVANALLPALAASLPGDVWLVDVHRAMAPDGAVTPGLLAFDGVHPTPLGYRVIADVLRPAVEAALRAR